MRISRRNLFLLATTLAVVGLLQGARAEERSPGSKPANPRSTLEEFLSLALAGKDQEACALTDPKKATCRQVGDIREVVGHEKLRITRVDADDKASLGITSTVADDRGRNGSLLLHARKEADKWLIDDMDFEGPGGVERKLARFRKEHPAATQVLSRQEELARETVVQFLSFVRGGQDDRALEIVNREKLNRSHIQNLRQLDGLEGITASEIHADDQLRSPPAPLSRHEQVARAPLPSTPRTTRESG